MWCIIITSWNRNRIYSKNTTISSLKHYLAQVGTGNVHVLRQFSDAENWDSYWPAATSAVCEEGVCDSLWLFTKGKKFFQRALAIARWRSLATNGAGRLREGTGGCWTERLYTLLRREDGRKWKYSEACWILNGQFLFHVCGSMQFRIIHIFFSAAHFVQIYFTL